MKNALIALVVVIAAFIAIWKIWPGGSKTAEQTNSPTASPSVFVSPSPSPTPKASVSPSASVQPEKGPVSVLIDNFAFSPSSPVIRRGTKVTWTNNDTVPHIIRVDNGVLVSPSLAPGQSYSFTFNTVGTFAYHSSLYPATKGTIEVVK